MSPTSRPPFRSFPTTLATLLLLTACPGDDTGTNDEGSSGEPNPATTTGPQTPPADDTTTSGPPPTTNATEESSGGTTAATGQTDSTDSGTTDTEETDSTTGGMGVCEVMLPPPMACPAAYEPGTPEGLANWLPFDRTAAGLPSVGDVTTPDDPIAGGAFILPPDGGGGLECDIFAQDCDPGLKCMPWSNDGSGSWNDTTCSPIAAMPDQLGDPCMVEGSGTSGVDSCDIGLMCWDVDAATNEGTCIEMCSCTPDNPVCNTANTVCTISNSGVLALCLPVCNPLDPDACVEGQGCYPVGDFFQCAPDASGDDGGAGDPCQYINGCDPGTVCVGGSLVPGCPGGSPGCCSSMCNPAEGVGACLAGQDCIAWYEPGAAPDACLGQAGVCITP